MSEGIAPGIDRKRRVSLVHAPTPLEPLKGLSKLLGAAEIWIKRDDCTGLAMGGNKVRKLEFLLAEARGAEADTIITIGAAQSNHVRLTAAAARVLGMEPVSLIFSGDDSQPQGNLLLDRLFGARMVTLPFPFEDSTPARIDQQVREISETLRAEGRNPYFIPAGGATPLGALGYMRATEEIAHQARAGGCAVDDVFVPFGTGGTLAGLLVGVDALRLKWRIHGVSAAPEGAWRQSGVASFLDLAKGAAGLLGQEFRLGPDRYEVSYDQVGPAYASLTPACAEAIRTVARSDGILLDPVYTGKAMACLIERIGRGEFPRGRTVVFLHTGGSPALFTRTELAGPG